MMVVYYIQSWKLWYIVRHNLVLQSIASGLRKHNLSAALLRFQLLISLSIGCRPLIDIKSASRHLKVCVSQNFKMCVYCGRSIH